MLAMLAVETSDAIASTPQDRAVSVKITEQSKLDKLVVYKGAKPSEYADLMKAPDVVQGDPPPGEYRGLLATETPAQASGASISMVKYENGVSQDGEDVDGPGQSQIGPDGRPLLPPNHYICEYQPKHCLPARPTVTYLHLAEAGGIVKYTIPGPIDLVTVDYDAGSDPTEVASAVKKKLGIDQDRYLVPALGTDGRFKALRLQAKNTNGSVRQEILVPWAQIEGKGEHKPKIESAYKFDGVANYENGKPGDSPSWTQARMLQRDEECKNSTSQFCRIGKAALAKATAEAQADAQKILKDPSFKPPHPAPHQKLTDAELTQVANDLAKRVSALHPGARDLTGLGKGLAKALKGVISGVTAGIQAAEIAESAAGSNSGDLEKVCSALGPIPIVGDIAGIVNAAAEGDAVEIVKNVLTLGLSMVSVAFPPLAPVADAVAFVLEVAVFLGKYLWGLLFPAPPDPREEAYKANQALHDEAGVRLQWEYAQYGQIKASPRQRQVLQSLVVTAKSDLGFSPQGFTEVGYSDFYLRTVAVRVYQDGIRVADLTCRFMPATGNRYPSDDCESPVPLLATAAHPLRIEFIYDTDSRCGNGTVCKNRDVDMQLTRPGEKDLPLKYAIYG
ncbi:hypothetical protein D5S17_30855 [Pseudonocardiaceae bacterium YIM PH 21723]|nr:hypothetical protein D5S17_30855 [Pseudonocardiaceae bacterium YIM PH 21723]